MNNTATPVNRGKTAGNENGSHSHPHLGHTIDLYDYIVASYPDDHEMHRLANLMYATL